MTGWWSRPRKLSGLRMGRRGLVKLAGLGAVAALAPSIGVEAQTGAASCLAAGESLYDIVRKRGTLIVGVRYDAPPMGSMNKQGEVEGFGIDLAAEFAKRLGVNKQFVSANASNRIPLVTGGHVDLTIEQPTISVQRQQIVDFTFPYIWEGIGPLVRQDSPIDDVKQFKPPIKIGAARGTANMDAILAVVPDAAITQYPDIAATVVALKQGLVDVVTTNMTSARLLASRNPDLKVGKPFFEDSWGIVLRQNDSRWRNWLEFTMQKMWLEGLYQDIYKKWYVVDPDFTLWSSGFARLQPGINTWDGKV